MPRYCRDQRPRHSRRWPPAPNSPAKVYTRPPSDVYSSFGGFVFDEGGYFEGGYEGGSFGDDGAGA